LEKYQLYLDKIKYGNKTIGTNVTTFWLEGNFAISAVEQISFLRNLVTENLPFSKKNISIMKDIMVNEKTDNYIIRAKTGYAVRVNPQHGWFVGYIDNKNEIWLFATNIDIKSPQDLSLRKEVTIASFKAKKIIK
jgi:beta-lactamase class D